jgi:cytochrome c biogenesis protein CcmG/thiol:disulfide interchange protein DsbE
LNRKVLAAGLVLVLPLFAVLVLNLGRDPHALVGRPAPAFELRPVGGGAPVSLAALRGKPIVVNFWATWCMPCLEEHAALQEGARASGAQFLGIVYEDDEGNVSNFIKQRGGSSYPSLMDEGGRTAIAYGVGGVPETYFIDSAGTIVRKFAGPLSPDALADLLRQVQGAS